MRLRLSPITTRSGFNWVTPSKRAATSPARSARIGAPSRSARTTLDAHLQLGHAIKLGGRLDEATQAYLKSLELDPKNKHARYELANLGLSGPSISRFFAGKRTDPRKAQGSGRQIAFDVSDLMHYFLDARTPTGIQRVQMNVVTSILGQERQDVDVMIVCFTEKVDFWVEIPPETFLRICRLALWGGTTKDPVWRKTIDDLHVDLAIGDPVTFARGACLLNLGTSWWLQNYFLMVRYAKATHGVHYIPFVHDCIPVMAPEHCVRELTQDFITWLLGVFLHADGFLVNSKATGADLTNVGKFLGHSIAPPKSIYLDGADAASAEPPSALEAANASSVLADNNLERRPFVLFVSTIESRKNHLLAFNAWLKMIRKRGLANTPMLVCVGNAGWMVDAALGRLASSDLLKKKVVMLSKISDAELAALYRGCVFTIYPSSYEGWGLPVTESILSRKGRADRQYVLPSGVGGNFRRLFRSGFREGFPRQARTPHRRSRVSRRAGTADQNFVQAADVGRDRFADHRRGPGGDEADRCR